MERPGTPARRLSHGDTVKKGLLQNTTNFTKLTSFPQARTGKQLEKITKPYEPTSYRSWALTTGPRILSRTYPSSTARGMASSLYHNLCNCFQCLNFLILPIKTLGKKIFDFPKVLPSESQTSFKLSQERQSTEAGTEASRITSHYWKICSLVVCVLRDCKIASMKLPDGEIKKTILSQHPDNMQSTYIETIINFKNTG